MTDYDDYTQMIIDNAYGRGPDRDEVLRADLHRWRATLVDLIADAMQQQTNLNAEWELYGTEKRDPGEYARVRAEISGRRGRVGHFRRKIESSKRRVDLLIREEGSRMHEQQTRSGRWRALCLWILGDYDDDEWASLEATVPADLADQLAFARTLHDEQRSDTAAAQS